ncbi:hypothetical protein BGZ76_003293, partial [Entomortierella beljakovae]
MIFIKITIIFFIAIIAEATSFRRTFRPGVTMVPQYAVGLASKILDVAKMMKNNVDSHPSTPYSASAESSDSYYSLGDITEEYKTTLSYYLSPTILFASYSDPDFAAGVQEMMKWANELAASGQPFKTEGILEIYNSGGCPHGTLAWEHTKTETYYSPVELNVTRTAAPFPTVTPSALRNSNAEKLEYIKNATHLFTMPQSGAPNTNSVSTASLCKRSDDVPGGDMYICKGADTILPSVKYYSGSSLWMQYGARMFVQSDGNLCLWSYKPRTRTYWCWNHGIVLPKDVGYIQVSGNGRLCLRRTDNDATAYCTPNIYNSPNDWRYRLTLQNDGNLVLYRGVSEKVMWASNSAVYPFTGPTPCTGEPMPFVVVSKCPFKLLNDTKTRVLVTEESKIISLTFSAQLENLASSLKTGSTLVCLSGTRTDPNTIEVNEMEIHVKSVKFAVVSKCPFKLPNDTKTRVLVTEESKIICLIFSAQLENLASSLKTGSTLVCLSGTRTDPNKIEVDELEIHSSVKCAKFVVAGKPYNNKGDMVRVLGRRKSDVNSQDCTELVFNDHLKNIALRLKSGDTIICFSGIKIERDYYTGFKVDEM